jgi:hypothetical protein
LASGGRNLAVGDFWIAEARRSHGPRAYSRASII